MSIKNCALYIKFWLSNSDLQAKEVEFPNLDDKKKAFQNFALNWSYKRKLGK